MSSQEAETYKNEGNQLLQKGEYASAIEKYTKAIELNNVNHIYYANRCLAYMKLKDYIKAKEDINKSIEINKTYVKALLRRATIECYFNNYTNAMNDYKSVLELEPTNAEAVKGKEMIEEEMKLQQQKQQQKKEQERKNNENEIKKLKLIDNTKKLESIEKALSHDVPSNPPSNYQEFERNWNNIKKEKDQTERMNKLRQYLLLIGTALFKSLCNENVTSGQIDDIYLIINNTEHSSEWKKLILSLSRINLLKLFMKQDTRDWLFN